MSLLREANEAMKAEDYGQALKLYGEIVRNQPRFRSMLLANMIIARKNVLRESFADINADRQISPYKDYVHGVLFVLPCGLDSPLGYQVQQYVTGLMGRGVECLVAVPDADYRQDYVCSPWIPGLSQPEIHPYSTISKFWKLLLSCEVGGRFVVHAWTRDEGVRSLLAPFLDSAQKFIFLQMDAHLLASADVARPGSPAPGGFLDFDTLDESGGAVCSSVMPVVDERLFHPRPVNAGMRRELGIPEENTVIVWSESAGVGRPEAYAELLEAVYRLNEEGVPATLVGTGGEDGKPEQKLAQYEKRLGWVEREKLPEVLAMADMFVYPSGMGARRGSVPSSLAESCAMGRPVVVSGDLLKGKLVHGKHAHVLEKCDVGSIAGAVSEIAADGKLARRLSAGAVVAYREFMAGDAAELLVRFYDDTLAALIKEPVDSGE